MFLNGDNAAGIYATQWYVDGRPVVVTVDDYFPVGSDDKWAYVTAKSEGIIWPMVLAKAWAKLHGSYANSEGGYGGRILRKLTAGAKRPIHHHTVDLLGLKKYMKRPDYIKFYMTAGKNPHVNCGLSNWHYSVWGP